MQPPAFWSDPDGARSIFARLLLPFSALYQWADRRKRADALAFQAALPVICVGNATMGGVGKTPFAILLSDMLRAEGGRPGFLTRGYGGREAGPILVGDDHDAAAIGDEALLLARHGPVMVARDRAAGARALAATGKTDCLLMDDGFQNPGLAKDVSFLLVDAEAGFGNGLVFPAGPLREQPEAARERAGAVVVVTSSASAPVPEDLVRFAGDKPMIRAWLEPIAAAPQPVIAFCGIGRPAKFFSTLQAAGYTLVETRAFADHHAWREADIDGLMSLSRHHGVPLITTEKDHVRLPSAARDIVNTLPVRMAVDDPGRLGEVISPVLAGR